MSVWNSEGLVGRCDAKCYDAGFPDCDCICGGKNHGAGLQQAAGNTRQHAEEMIAEFARARDLTTFESAIQRNPGHKQVLRRPISSEEPPLLALLKRA